MDILIASDQRCVELDGKIYVEATGKYSFWSRYLSVFDHVYIAARVKPVTSIPEKMVRADGPGVDFVRLPYYRGVLEGIATLPSLVLALRREIRPNRAYIMRVPAVVGSALHALLTLHRFPYAVEVCGDPHDSIQGFTGAGAVRRLMVHMTQQQIVRAAAASYVTESALQRRYPAAKHAVTTHYSSVEMQSQRMHYAAEKRAAVLQARAPMVERTIELLFVGRLEVPYKGLPTLLRALQILKRKGMSRFQLTIVGGGILQGSYEKLAHDLELAEQVSFLGFMPPGEPVLDIMCESDLLIMPSLQEGLPRALIEAMACGLPCIGTNIGGIPELLPPDYIVPPGEPEALADKMLAVLSNPNKMAEMGHRNQELAQAYRDEILQQRRINFLHQVETITAAYCEGEHTKGSHVSPSGQELTHYSDSEEVEG